MGDRADIAFALDGGIADADATVAFEFWEQVFRLTRWPQHGVDEMHPAAFVGEHMRDEHTLIDLQAFLGDLFFQRAFGIDLFAGRQQTRKMLGGVIDQFGDAQGQGTVLGEGVVHRHGMAAEKRFLGLADGLLERGAVGARAFDRPRRLREILLRGFGVLRQGSVETRTLRKTRKSGLERRIHGASPFYSIADFWYNDVLLKEFCR